jgi:hypothetical protein
MVMVAFLLLLGAPVGYLPQVRLLARSRSGFPAAAALPLLGWGVGAPSSSATSRDPTWGNLFPFEIRIGVALALPHLGFLAGAGRLCRGPPAV